MVSHKILKGVYFLKLFYLSPFSGGDTLYVSDYSSLPNDIELVSVVI